MKNKKWRIIFDYDDTLIRHNIDVELKLMAEYLELDYTKEFKQQFTSFYLNMALWDTKEKITMCKFENYLYETVPLFAQNSLGIAELFAAEEYKDKKLSLLTEGVEETLDYLVSKGYYLCVLTNGFLIEQYSSLKHQGLLSYFEKIYAWDNFYAKPDERAFLRALNGTKPEENIMVGNNLLHDIIPAKKLGICTYGIHLKNQGNNSVEPDVNLEKITDLKIFL